MMSDGSTRNLRQSSKILIQNFKKRKTTKKKRLVYQKRKKGGEQSKNKTYLCSHYQSKSKVLVVLNNLLRNPMKVTEGCRNLYDKQDGVDDVIQNQCKNLWYSRYVTWNNSIPIILNLITLLNKLVLLLSIPFPSLPFSYSFTHSLYVYF